MRDELRLTKMTGDKVNNIPTIHAPDAGVVDIIKCWELNVSDMLPVSLSIEATPVEVRPITIRKTPKFPSRDRHLAIRRKKAAATTAETVHQPKQSIIMEINNKPGDDREKEEPKFQDLSLAIGPEE